MKSGAIWMELHALHKHGWTISALAREFGLNWRTVKRELESGAPRRYAERAKPTALTEAQQAHVEPSVCSYDVSKIRGGRPAQNVLYSDNVDGIRVRDHE